MPTIQKTLDALTAEDLMTRDVLLLTGDMPLREAARLLLRNQVSGAPVMNDRGMCVGVLSASDFVRLTSKRNDATRPSAPELPVTCSFQRKHKSSDGTETILCTLPPRLNVAGGGKGGERASPIGPPRPRDWQWA